MSNVWRNLVVLDERTADSISNLVYTLFLLITVAPTSLDPFILRVLLDIVLEATLIRVQSIVQWTFSWLNTFFVKFSQKSSITSYKDTSRNKSQHFRYDLCHLTTCYFMWLFDILEVWACCEFQGPMISQWRTFWVSCQKYWLLTVCDYDKFATKRVWKLFLFFSACSHLSLCIMPAVESYCGPLPAYIYIAFTSFFFPFHSH